MSKKQLSLAKSRESWTPLLFVAYLQLAPVIDLGVHYIIKLCKLFIFYCVWISHGCHSLCIFNYIIDNSAYLSKGFSDKMTRFVRWMKVILRVNDFIFQLHLHQQNYIARHLVNEQSPHQWVSLQAPKKISNPIPWSLVIATKLKFIEVNQYYFLSIPTP